MTDKPKEEDAPTPRPRKETSQQAGITLRLGPDSKLSLPIQGGNLVMMLVIAGQLFFRYASLPDDVSSIKDSQAQIQLEIEGIKAQSTERDKSIGSLETRVEILEGNRDEQNVKISDLESAKTKDEARITSLEKENERLVNCVVRPSKCRL